MSLIENLQNLLHAPGDQVVYFLLMLSSLPFCQILSKMIIKDIPVNLIHFYCALVGFCYVYFICGWSSLHLLFLFLISYMTVCCNDRSKVGFPVFVYSMLHLSICHIILMYKFNAGHVLNMGTPMMVLVQRTTLFAYDVQDAFSRDINYKTPSFLEYLSYCYFFPTVLTGPTIDFHQYEKAISGSIIKEYSKMGLKFSIKRFFSPFICAVVSGIFCVFLGSKFPIEKILLSEEINNLSSLQIFFIYYMYIIGVRCKYYTCWKLAECACNLCYMGFKGVSNDGKQDWTGCKNVRIRKVEFSNNLKTIIDNWNISTTLWLRKTVYTRTKYYPVFLTFFISAIWHGFYPHYLVLFITMSSLIKLSRIARYRIRPYFLSSKYLKFLYDAITLVLSSVSLSFQAAPFAFLDFYLTWLLWSKLYFIGHLFLFSGPLMLLIPVKKETKTF